MHRNPLENPAHPLEWRMACAQAAVAYANAIAYERAAYYAARATIDDGEHATARHAARDAHTYAVHAMREAHRKVLDFARPLGKVEFEQAHEAHGPGCGAIVETAQVLQWAGASHPVQRGV